eukprot:g6721.t1
MIQQAHSCVAPPTIKRKGRTPPIKVRKKVNRQQLKAPEQQVTKRKFDAFSPTSITDTPTTESKYNDAFVACAHEAKIYERKHKRQSKMSQQHLKNRLLKKLLNLRAEMGHNEKMLHDQFQFQRKLGEGISGQVLHCVHQPTGKNVAVKMIKKGDDSGIREIEAQSYLTGLPQVLPLLAHFETKNHRALVLPYFPAGDLYYILASESMEHLRRNEPKVLDRIAAKVIKQICIAVKCLHKAGFAHLDIKPENFLCSGNIVKDSNNLWICDFGYTMPCTDTLPINDGVVRGSGGYISPECAIGLDCSQSSDIWSIGSIAHVLLTGHVPFVYDINLAKMQFQKKEPPMALQKDSKFELTARSQNFLKSVFNYDKGNRLTINECLNHPWLWGV